MTPQLAVNILKWAEVPMGADFHKLPSSKVELLLEYADAWKYRQPRNANGSRGRYWHAYLQRRANKAT